MSNLKLVGHVRELWRYPVKSMAPEALEQSEVSWFGIAGDRRWAFVRDGTSTNDFPWLTIRERNDLMHFSPTFEEPDRPDQSSVIIQSPTGERYQISDADLANRLFPDGARLIKQNRGIYDTFPLSMITTQSIKQIGDRLGSELSPQRFRPNFLVDAIENVPFPEDSWVSHVLRIGTLRMRVDKRDGRCAVINVDPKSSHRDPGVLKAVVHQNDGCLGVYGTTVRPGKARVGDAVYLDESSDNDESIES